MWFPFFHTPEESSVCKTPGILSGGTEGIISRLLSNGCREKMEDLERRGFLDLFQSLLALWAQDSIKKIGGREKSLNKNFISIQFVSLNLKTFLTKTPPTIL